MILISVLEKNFKLRLSCERQQDSLRSKKEAIYSERLRKDEHMRLGQEFQWTKKLMSENYKRKVGRQSQLTCRKPFVL